MVNNQSNKCKGCGDIFKSEPDIKIDHCHNTGIVRGLLCSHCNTALGLLKDNPSTLKNLLKYLSKNGETFQIT